MTDTNVPFSKPHVIQHDGKDALIIRPFFLRKGQEYRGHTHMHDHTTIVFTGKLAVQFDDGPEEEKKGFTHFVAKAGVKHTIRALEDTHYGCTFFVPPDFYDDPIKLTMED